MVVGESNCGWVATGGNLIHDGAVEAIMAILDAQRAPLRVPTAVKLAALDEALGLHLEDVHEIRLQGEVQHKADPLAAIGDEGEVLVNALADGAIYRQANAVGWHFGILALECRVGEADARSIEADLAGRGERPGPACDGDVVAADEARIDRED